MKASRLTSVTCAIAALTIVTVDGQYESSTTTTTTTYVPTTIIVGSRVMGPQGEEIGQITDVVLDKQTGCMAYVVLSTEQNGTRKTVAAPWEVFSPGSDNRTYTVRVDREKIYSAPVWESSRIDEYSRTDWITNVYSYYGVQPQVGVNVRTNLGNRGDQRREREQMNAQRRERAGQTPNPDTLTQPPQNPNRRGAANANAAPANSASPASSPSEQRRDRGRMMHQGASATPSERASATPEGAAAERPRGESRRGEETRATATPESNRQERRGERRQGAQQPSEAGTTTNPNAAGASETPANAHHAKQRAPVSQSPAQASPTP